eukprot:947415-Prorocentrum_minimum.AAC.1
MLISSKNKKCKIAKNYCGRGWGRVGSTRFPATSDGHGHDMHATPRGKPEGRPREAKEGSNARIQEIPTNLTNLTGSESDFLQGFSQ